MHNFKIETYFKIIFIISVVAIISAFYIEYILGHQPCKLCLIERIPYVLSVILVILKYFFRNNEKFIILLLFLVFAFSFIIAFYHFGIEQGFFEESAFCGVKNSTEIISKEELLKQLQENTISCRDVTFRIFGFSLTIINMLISLILLILLSTILKDYEKNKK